jgi:hypothetical protein
MTPPAIMPARDAGRYLDPAAGAFVGDGAGPPTVVLSFVDVSLSVGDVLDAGADAPALPRITGNPSLPLPMITTFELVDCES